MKLRSEPYGNVNIDFLHNGSATWKHQGPPGSLSGSRQLKFSYPRQLEHRPDLTVHSFADDNDSVDEARGADNQNFWVNWAQR